MADHRFVELVARSSANWVKRVVVDR